MITLYRKHVNGIGTWRIWKTADDTITMAHATVEGGQEVAHTETVTVNQSGRSLEEQVNLRINSRVSRQMDRGYTLERDKALLGNVNQLGLLQPMLAQPIQKVKKINYEGAVLQLKLNGHRCLATKQDGEIILYSRKGKLIKLPHVADYLQGRLPEGTTIDGELYCHGMSLQAIGSLIKKPREESLVLRYFCYDLVAKDPFPARYAELLGIVTENPFHTLTPTSDRKQPVQILGIIPYQGEYHMRAAFRRARIQGYEGLILRTNDRPYEDGVRSHSLLKIKEFLDCEVTVDDIVLSPKGVVVCICRTDDGKRVDVVPPGAQAEKMTAYENKAEYIGRRMTIDYAELSEDGVPMQPVGREWREDV